ncbi:MAG: Hpt domain-containing protein, partial [Dechloromonas sp.]|nr:Hpt domain-containing protein [Dechloromonas sp.]
GMAHIEVLSNLSGEFDLDRITRIVHNLKSSSAALGLMDFSARCKEAEQAARSQQSAKLLSLLPDIVSEFALVRSAAEKLLEELGRTKGE